MSTDLVYIIVVNWNLKDITLECLDSIFQLTYPNFRVIVVDNASQDGSPAAIAERYPQLEQIINPINEGFGKAFNKGIVRALEQGAEYILLMNNDAWIEPAGLEKLLCHMDSGIGMLAPVIYYARNPDIVWSAGGNFNSLTLEIRQIGEDAIQLLRGSSTLSVDFVTACVVFLPRLTFERVGLFDERFHAYYEDMDFAQRVKRFGLKVRVVLDTHAWHKISMSSGGSHTPNERYWMARSSIRYFSKHSRWWQRPVIVGYRFGSALKMTLRLVLEKKYSSARAYWQGLMDGILENIIKGA
jgi:hypothetical protein